jgi:hypothetical protein
MPLNEQKRQHQKQNVHKRKERQERKKDTEKNKEKYRCCGGESSASALLYLYG